MSSSAVLGQLPTVPAAAAVYPHSFYATEACGSQATTTFHANRVPTHQLRESWALCQELLLAKAGQFTTYSSACGEPSEESAERSSTVI
jgi:hypothetical protein